MQIPKQVSHADIEDVYGDLLRLAEFMDRTIWSGSIPKRDWDRIMQIKMSIRVFAENLFKISHRNVEEEVADE